MKLYKLMSRLSAFPAVIAACLGLAAALAGCGGPSAATAPPTAAATLVPPPTATPAPLPTPTAAAFLGAAAPDFAIRLFQGEDTLGGRELMLSDVTGRPLVLNFWARFCGPCWAEMPDLQNFYDEYGDRVRLLGIDVGQFTGLGSPKDAGKLLDALGVTYPAGYTDDAQVVPQYRIRAMPTTVFISADGRVFETWTGAISRERVAAIARRMLERE